jgi:hypothetical protein
MAEFKKWTDSLQLRNDLEFENELYIACILLQGAAEGIAERGTERHNLNSIYWNDTQETVSFAALGDALGCTSTVGVVLSSKQFWLAFDEFVITGNVGPLEEFEEKLLEYYKDGSVFYKLLNGEEQTVQPGQETARQESSSQQAVGQQSGDTVTAEQQQEQQAAVRQEPPTVQHTLKRSIHYTRRVHGRRAITPIRHGRRHHKTPRRK